MPYQAAQSIQRNESVYSSEIDDELVLMDEESGVYYGLETTGYFIWEALANGKTFGELIDSLVADYDVDRETCIKDTTTFLEKMSENDLIQVA